MVTIPKTAKTQMDPPEPASGATSGPTPEMVQTYIAAMLRELSEMANDSGLKNLSSLLQVTMLASSPELKNLD